jgi:predicted Zn-dependent peptidase
MEYIEKDCGAFKLHVYKTDKFRTVNVSVIFRRVIKKEEITIRNVLAKMLLMSSKNYKSKRDLAIKEQELYSTEIDNSTYRLGNYIFTNFDMNVLNDKYTEENNLEEAIKFLSEIIFKPDVTNKKFNEEYLEIVKNKLSNKYNSIKEEPAKYSITRLNEVFNSNSPISYRPYGYIEDLDNINTDNLYKYYESFINHDFIDIYVVGNVNNDVIKMIKKYFKFRTVKRRRVPYKLNKFRVRSRKLKGTESTDNSQSRIAIMCPIGKLSDREEKYVLPIYNYILGGGVDSKLFREVREKNSLCYSIGSLVRKFDGVMMILSGIDNSNYAKCIELIEKELQDMRWGKFTNKDLNIAKEYYQTSLDDIMENPNGIINDCLVSDLLKLDSIDKRREEILKVSKNDIVKVAKKIKLDTIFNLEGLGVNDEE